MNRTVLIVFALIILGLLAWNYFLNTPAQAGFWNDTQIACLPNGHENLAQHIHPELTITVDGEREVVPANIGLTPSCMAEIHTHDATGKIHIESVTERTFTLAEFFLVWGKTLEREGYTVAVTADGEVVADPGALVLKDHQQLKIIYSAQ